MSLFRSGFSFASTSLRNCYSGAICANRTTKKNSTGLTSGIVYIWGQPTRGAKTMKKPGWNPRHRKVRTTRIILLEDIPNVGFKGDTAHVRPGYHRNFLHPQNLAVYATKENLEKYGIDGTASGGADGIATGGAIQSERQQLIEERKVANSYVTRLGQVRQLYRRGDIRVPALKTWRPVTLEEITEKLASQDQFYGITPKICSFEEGAEGVVDGKIVEYGEYKVQIDVTKNSLADGVPPLGMTTLCKEHISPEDLPCISVVVEALPIGDAVEKAQRDAEKQKKRAERMAAKKSKKGKK